MNLDNILKNIPVKQRCKYFKRRANMARLPHPVTFYRGMGFTLKAGTTWQKVKCPFHDDKTPSLNINTAHGGYKCHACGAKGDMIEFYKSYHKVDFRTACEQLDLFEEVN